MAQTRRNRIGADIDHSEFMWDIIVGELNGVIKLNAFDCFCIVAMVEVSRRKC